MTTSIIINTAADAPHAKHVNSSGGVPYSWRAYALQNFILPAYIESSFIDEVIVAGHWHAGAGYRYLPVEAVHFNWADCIAQRQAGFEAAFGDTLIFQHDDHLLRLKERFVPAHFLAADVISPDRFTRARLVEGEPLNSGRADGYIDGHCAIYKREVIERCPWKDVPIQFTMDKAHTEQIKAACFRIHWSRVLKVQDVEYGATPWL